MSIDVIDSFRKTGALLEGHFLLRSGLHSRQYFQCALLLQHAKLASELVGELSQKVKHHPFDAIISPAMGGILVGQEMAKHLNTRHIFAENSEGKLKMRRFQIKPGEKFIIAEDVVTTGSAVREVMQIVRDAGAEVTAVGVLVDRSGYPGVEFGVPFYNLLKLKVETFPADQVPDDLKNTPAIKPGSK